jgi:hypothetical protein
MSDIRTFCCRKVIEVAVEVARGAYRGFPVLMGFLIDE